MKREIDMMVNPDFKGNLPMALGYIPSFIDQSKQYEDLSVFVNDVSKAYGYEIENIDKFTMERENFQLHYPGDKPLDFIAIIPIDPGGVVIIYKNSVVYFCIGGDEFFSRID